MAWWVKFSDGEEGCLGYGNLPEAEMPHWPAPDVINSMDNNARKDMYQEHADNMRLLSKRVAEQLRPGKTVRDMDGLPYDASPMLKAYPGCMTLCYTPHQCKGRSSCPKRRACSE
jgi:hypothetical protein